MKKIWLFAVVLLAAVVSSFAATNGGSRVARAQADLANLEAMARESTNEADRAIWERRVALAQKGVENARRLATLEAKAGELSRNENQRGDTFHVLRGMVRDIESNTSSTTNAAGEMDRKIRQLRDARAAIASDKIVAGDDEEEAQQARAKQNQRVLSLDAQIAAAMFQRDALDYELRLKQESQRIDSVLREDALSASPSIGAILAKRRAAADAVKSEESFAATLERVREQRDGVAEKAGIERERLKYLDDEVTTLAELNKATKNSIFSFKKQDPALAERQKRIALMLAEASSEKEALGVRIQHFEAQVAALDGSVDSLQKAVRLIAAERIHLDARILDLTQRLTRKVAIPAAIALAILLVQFLLSRAFFPLMFKRENLLMARRGTMYFALMLITLVVAVSFLDDLKAIATMLGLVGAAIVIALQDLCSAFAGWFVIMAGRKVRVGDRVEIDGVKGDIVDIQILRTTLLELNNWLGVDEETGRVITIPNSFIFKSAIFNYTRMHPYIWDKMDVLLTRETPFKESQALIKRILEEETKDEFVAACKAEEEAEHKFGLPQSHYKPKLYTSLAESGVLHTLVYVSYYKHVSDMRTRLGQRILAELDGNVRIRLAYPTSRQFEAEETPQPASK